MTKLVSGRLKAQPNPGPHPAPELLAGFAENALPEADRGLLLQHLGACSECREILYLSLPDSPETQKVLVLRPRPFRRWALGWGALVASFAIVAVFFSANRVGHRNQAAPVVAAVPAAATETKIAAEKTPPELDQMQAARNASVDKMAVARDRNENKPEPEAKHMTAKLQPQLVFEESGEVHVQTPATSAGAAAPVIRSREDKKNLSAVAAFNGAATPGSSGKLGALAYPTTAPSKSGADRQAAVNQQPAAQADAAREYNSLPIEDRNLANRRLFTNEPTAKGNLDGIILDPSGAAVANAKVTMAGPIGTKTVTSDPQGRFAFDLLSPGSYSIKAEASGFKTAEIKQVAVLDNKTASVPVTLELGSASEVVEVAAAAPVLETSSGVVSAPLQATAQLSRQRAAGNSRKQGLGVGSLTGAATYTWTLSPEGGVQRSGDSGKTWQIVSVLPGATFRALSAVAANIWVGGKAGALYHSADFGQTWAKCEPAAGGNKLDQDIVSLDFSDASNGTVNAANGEVWTTSDGGQTWLRK